MSTFTSSFGPHIEAMLEWRTALGHSPRDMTSAMAGFTVNRPSGGLVLVA